MEFASNGSGVPFIGIGNAAGSTKVSLSSGTTYFDATNVGIGVTSPDTRLEVAGDHVSGKGLIHIDSSDHAFIALDAAGSSNDSGIYFQEAGTTQFVIDHDGSGNALRIHDGSSEFVFVNSSGNVGIGTTSPLAPLHIHNGHTGAGNLYISDTKGYNAHLVVSSSATNADANITLGSNGNSGRDSYIFFRSNGDLRYYLQHDTDTNLFKINSATGTAIIIAITVPKVAIFKVSQTGLINSSE